MALKLNGYFAYIIEEQGSNVIKFGITKNIHTRYAAITSTNPRDFILRSYYFFQSASKKDLQNYFEKKIKTHEFFSKYKVRQDSRTEMLVNLPYEWLEFELMMIWLDWNNQYPERPHNLIKGTSNSALQKKILEGSRFRMHEAPKSLNFNDSNIKSINGNSYKDINFIYERLNLNLEFGHQFSTQPYQMTAICEKCGIKLEMANYKSINKFLKSKNIKKRRSNGKNLYDLHFKN